MSEFTDGTMTGNTLSMVDMEKRLEAVAEKCKTIPVIDSGVINTVNLSPASGTTVEVKFNHTFKNQPRVFVNFYQVGAYWTWCNMSVGTVSNTGTTLNIFNDNKTNTATVNIIWTAIGQEV